MIGEISIKEQPQLFSRVVSKLEEEKELKKLVRLDNLLNNDKYNIVQTGLLNYINCNKSKVEGNKAKSYIDKGYNTIDESLEVTDFINIKEEFKLIKELLFSKDELDIIQEIVKRSILYDEDIFNEPEFINVKQSLDEFLSNKNKKGKSTIRVELFEILERKITECFGKQNE